MIDDVYEEALEEERRRERAKRDAEDALDAIEYPKRVRAQIHGLLVAVEQRRLAALSLAARGVPGAQAEADRCEAEIGVLAEKLARAAEIVSDR